MPMKLMNIAGIGWVDGLKILEKDEGFSKRLLNTYMPQGKGSACEARSRNRIQSVPMKPLATNGLRGILLT